jgi:methyl-accepting chemotaxis protein
MKLLHRTGRWLASLRVSHQLFGSFGLLLVLTLVVGGLADLGLSRVNAQASNLATQTLPSLGHLADARVALLAAREFEAKHGRSTDASYFSEYEEKIGEQTKVVDKSLADFIALHAGDADIGKLHTATAKAWQDYRDSIKKVVDLGRAKKHQDAADISDGLAATNFDTALGALDKLNKSAFEAGVAAGEQAALLYRQTRIAMLTLVGSALLLGLVLAVLIPRNLLRQLGGEPAVATRAVQAVATGDLRTPIAVPPGRESSLLGRIREMQASLADVVRAVRADAHSVAIASQQIASGNSDLSQRTEQQAASLQRTAAAMEQLGTTVGQNADHARQADQLAKSASDVAAQGGVLVSQVVDTMRGINDSSRKIADIISVIDSIAFQTNILALNAAVEAARAGEQGRGFAVVASEVRSLAQRSADAAKEIKTLIGASVERVEQGSSLVDKAGATMKDIVTSIQRVTDIMGEISQASGEQSAGVTQVGHAMTQMDQATQQNAALVEESAAAAESLQQQAKRLVEAVSVFQVADGGSAMAPLPVLDVVATPSPAAPAPAPTVSTAWTGSERRGPERAKNVVRPPFGAEAPTKASAPAKAAATTPTPPSTARRSGTDDDAEWEQF